MIDSFEQEFTIIFTNHDVVLNIIKQISMTTIFIDKLNFRFVRVSDYIQRFDVELRHKSDKQHIVSNVLFRFVNINIDIASNEKELNVLFIVVFVEIEKDFRRKFVANYVNDFH